MAELKCGVCICGLNGSGKTTLAEALSKELSFKHMDIEDYYFKPSEKPYSSSRSREQVEELISKDIVTNPCFVFSAVDGNITDEMNSAYDLVVYLDVPVDIRMKRIRKRSVDKFGDRVLPSGDMYEQEEEFFEFASKRDPVFIELWLNTLSCRVLYLDGTSSINENVKRITSELDLLKSLLLWEKGDRDSGG